MLLSGKVTFCPLHYLRVLDTSLESPTRRISRTAELPWPYGQGSSAVLEMAVEATGGSVSGLPSPSDMLRLLGDAAAGTAGTCVASIERRSNGQYGEAHAPLTEEVSIGQ